MKFTILDKEVDSETLPHREATELERRKMLGSLATVYEMKIPLLNISGTKVFFVLDDQPLEIGFDVPVTELVVLKTDIILPSIFRKWKKRRVSKKWQQ